MISPIIIDTMVKNNGAIIEYFGDTPKIRFLDFLIGNHFFDFNMTDMAREANISYNSLKSFFDEFLDKGIIIKTRRVGKSEMYKLNMDNAIVKNFLKFALVNPGPAITMFSGASCSNAANSSLKYFSLPESCS